MEIQKIKSINQIIDSKEGNIIPVINLGKFVDGEGLATMRYINKTGKVMIIKYNNSQEFAKYLIKDIRKEGSLIGGNFAFDEIGNPNMTAETLTWDDINYFEGLTQ